MVKDNLFVHHVASFITAFILSFLVGLSFFYSDQIGKDSFLQLTYNVLQSSITLLVMLMVVFIFVVGHVQNKENDLHKEKKSNNLAENSYSDVVDPISKYNKSIRKLIEIMNDTTSRSVNLLLFIALSIILALFGFIIPNNFFQIYASFYLGSITFIIIYLICWLYLILSQWKKIPM